MCAAGYHKQRFKPCGLATAAAADSSERFKIFKPLPLTTKCPSRAAAVQINSY